ncbi:MAG: S41 family peptidase [Bacteroidota bacterium]
MKKITKIALGLLTALLLFSAFRAEERYFEIAKNLDIFATLYREVNTYYVDDINPTKTINRGIDAMLASLDPYTNYISEDRIEDYRTMTTGEYGGIGASISTRNGKTMVAMPFEGFPADKGGLKIGDVILSIDGVNLSGKTSDDVSKLLKGQAGTSVDLTIERYGVSEPLAFTLDREKIHIDNVTYKGMVTEDVGMIHLTDFTNNASKEVKSALLDLKEKGAEKIILDLRGNPGGLLYEAINISNIFLPKSSEIVSTKGKVEEWNKSYFALNQSVDEEIPLVVLVNRGSASASEIVAGSIQDYDRGVVIGENSYGKGLVQATRSLTFNSKLKVTVAKYYIPSGRCIQAIDYSHRNPDGSVGKVPDSLRVAYKTQNGRVVYDGGGIKPDVEIERELFAPITQSLLSKNLIFDYANKYAAEHPEIAPAKEFALTDTEYAAFLKWLEGKSYDYTTDVERTIDDLEATAREEGSLGDLQDKIEGLRAAVSHDKTQDLKDFKDEIRETLEREIAMRYYLATGGVEATFDDDLEVQAALKLFEDEKKFDQILGDK